jgi:hypothetical protein
LPLVKINGCSLNYGGPPPPREALPVKLELVVLLDELVVVASFCSRCISALFCDELLLPLPLPLREVLLLWNIFCSTCNACCGSPLFM